jgi:hypothetical protein
MKVLRLLSGAVADAVADLQKLPQVLRRKSLLMAQSGHSQMMNLESQLLGQSATSLIGDVQMRRSDGAKE